MNFYLKPVVSSGMLCRRVLSNHCYVQQNMKKHLILIPLLFSISALSRAEIKADVYQVTLRAEQSDMRLFICINGECQKSLSFRKNEDEYIYDFGTFPVPKSTNIEFNAWRHYPEIRRIRRTREHYTPGICNVTNCGSFRFTKTNAPVTSTTDLCKLGLSSCGRGPTPR
jgi:hypothetical protein